MLLILRKAARGCPVNLISISANGNLVDAIPRTSTKRGLLHSTWRERRGNCVSGGLVCAWTATRCNVSCIRESHTGGQSDRGERCPTIFQKNYKLLAKTSRCRQSRRRGTKLGQHQTPPPRNRKRRPSSSGLGRPVNQFGSLPTPSASG